MATAPQQGRGVNFAADPKNKKENERSADSTVLRDFAGVNLQSPREDIGDAEFRWLEELIPIAAGNMALIQGPGTALVTVVGESGAPTLNLNYNVAGVDYVLAIWANSGDAWVGTPTLGSTWTKIASAKFTSGQTAAAQWSNQGVLIVDPVAGYYDYNVTAASTLTNLSGQLYSPVISTTNLGQLSGGTVPALRITDPTGTGGTIGASASLVSAIIAAPGAGYAVGDRLTATGGTLTMDTHAPFAQQNQPLVLTVISVAGGNVTGISVTSSGYYQAAPANPVAFTGGTGAGFTATASWAVGNPYVIASGVGYTLPVVQAFIGGFWVNYSMTISTSGTLLGTAIAVYVGRAWIAISRTVQFTDAGSYNSFANSGSSFTINDSYLHNKITALFAANNYLYIFGDDSVDILSNVTVVAGIAQFSRINASASIGTTQPLSIFPYLRTIAFANNSGFYVMSGATPEKVSDKLDDLIAATNFATKIYGVQIMIQNILCAAFLINFNDSFTQTPTVARSILAILFRGKWWFTSQKAANTGQINALVSLPISGLSTAFGWSGNVIYQLMAASNTNAYLLKTKLWDLQSPMLDKSGLLAGFGVVLAGNGLSGFNVYVDTEKSSVLTTLGAPLPAVQWVNNFSKIVTWINNLSQPVAWVLAPVGYELFLGQANNGGGKYIGMTVTGNNNTTQIRLLALEAERTRRW